MSQLLFHKSNENKNYISMYLLSSCIFVQNFKNFETNLEPWEHARDLQKPTSGLFAFKG
jgi:hypothetical protein